MSSSIDLSHHVEEKPLIKKTSFSRDIMKLIANPKGHSRLQPDDESEGKVNKSFVPQEPK